MANKFSKEEVLAFNDILEGFNDMLVVSEMVSKYDIGDVAAERTNDQIWRPIPYIAVSYDGIDQTGNFGDSTQLSVPATLGYKKSSNFTLSATEFRDGMQENRLIKAANQRLASDINVALMQTAEAYGTVVVARSGAATGYDDIAEADAAFNELGVSNMDRQMALSSRAYNGMAGNLAARQTMGDRVTKAFDKAYLGDVAGFETFKLDYARQLTGALGVGVTINGANQRHAPKATTTSVTGETSNVDNRTQTIDITVTSGAVKVGDAFTIAGVNLVHHITKEDQGGLKTFRVMELVSGAGGTGTIRISPAIVAADSTPTDAEKRYQNVTATPADNAVVTFLNTTTATVNPFWHKSAIELLPARYQMPDNGLATIRGTTDQGIDVLMARSGDINDLGTKYRLSTFFGTAALEPQMMGIELFGQV